MVFVLTHISRQSRYPINTFHTLPHDMSSSQSNVGRTPNEINTMTPAALRTLYDQTKPHRESHLKYHVTFTEKDKDRNTAVAWIRAPEQYVPTRDELFALLENQKTDPGPSEFSKVNKLIDYSRWCAETANEYSVQELMNDQITLEDSPLGHATCLSILGYVAQLALGESQLPPCLTKAHAYCAASLSGEA
jgi:hypothetical protein